VLATNRKALRDFHIVETLEAGVMLTGTEIKSLRQSEAQLQDSFALVEGEEIFLYNMHISPYAQGDRDNVEPKRRRKLLLHKAQIRRLIGQVSRKSRTIVPLRVYLKRGLAKVEIALAEGRRLYDKREALRRKAADRDVARELRAHTKRT